MTQLEKGLDTAKAPLPEQKGLHCGYFCRAGSGSSKRRAARTDHLIVKDDLAVAELHSVCLLHIGYQDRGRQNEGRAPG